MGENRNVNTCWVGTWRAGRRHQIKVSYTQMSRDVAAHTLQRDFNWGGQTYAAGLTAKSTSSADICAPVVPDTKKVK